MKKNNSEQGQAIIVVVIAFVILLGFGGLAIDAGMVYSDRRQAQNVADSSALAAAAKASLALENAGVNSSNWACSSATAVSVTTVAKSAAISRAATNNVTLINNLATGNGVDVTCVNDSAQADPRYMDITVQISTTTQATFSQFIFGGPLRSRVEAVTRIHPRTATFPGYAIVALNNCSSEGGHTVAITGGGNSGTVDTYNGGIFINSTGSSCCALDPGSSANGGTIAAHDGFNIANVGSCSYSNEDKVSPRPIQTGYNGGGVMSDPISNLPEPTCSVEGTVNADGTFNPGNWEGGDLGPGFLKPGIYCVEDDMAFSGSEVLRGDGIVLFLKDGGISFRGQSGMSINAPTAANCTTATCPYAGIVIFAARDNESTIDVRGNGGAAFAGTVYAISATLSAQGGGSNPDETQMIGQVIVARVENNGNGSLSVTYDQSRTYQKPTSMDLSK